MSEFLRNPKIKALYPWIVCLIPLLLAVFCCVIKSGGFVDEYFSLSFSNSSRGGYLIDSFDGNLIHRVITSDELRDYVAVEQDETFVYDYIIENCSSDMTPPLYYFILHTICSFFPGVLSKWFGLSINLLAYFVTLVFLYHSAMLLYKSRWVATLILFCYGFSAGGLNCVTYVRMYAMVTMWSVLLLYFILKDIQDGGSKYSVAAGIVIYLGFLTQYNFGIIAFFLCAATCVVLMFRKKIRKLLVFGGCSLAGVLLFLLSWPSLFKQTGIVVSWTNEAGRGDVGFFLSVYFWLRMIFFQLKTEVLLLAVLAIIIIGLKLFLGKAADGAEETAKRERIISAEYVIVTVAFILGTICIAHFAPYFSARYCFNVMPMFALVLGLPFIVFRKQLDELKKKKSIHFSMNVVGVIIAFVIVIGMPKFDQLMYLYTDNPEKLQVTESVSSYPCLFITTNREKAIINSIDHLVKFEDIYVSDELSAEEYDTYVSAHSNKDAIVVYVDIDPISSSGLDSDEVIGKFAETGLYDNIYVLYELDSARAFLLHVNANKN
ncbi:MAG: glycosyltransferase family 39 protein [Lachnospiraceae bacterium]|nr:glycosyltransferase family 39 protein [Lachnospiraceae bacterium]